MNTNNSPRDARRLWNIAQSVASKLMNTFGGQEFGKPLQNIGEDGFSKIVDTIVKEVFKDENKAIAESAGVSSNIVLQNGFRSELVKKFEEMYKPAAENSFFRYNQSSGHYLTHLGSTDQLHLVALIAGIIQSCYNVVFKTHVEKGLSFTREVDLPYALTHDGEVIDFFKLVNSAENLRKYAGVSSPIATLEFPVTGGKVEANLITEYNKALLLSDPNSTKLEGPYTFLNRGVEITEITYNGSPVQVKWVSNGYPTQSGQKSNVVAHIDGTFQDSEDNPTEIVNVLGQVRLNGDMVLRIPNSKATKVKVKFHLPPLGAKRPLSFMSRKTPLVVHLKKTFTADTPLNENFRQKHALVLGKDIIEEFHKYSITTLNRYKDTAAFDFVDETIAKLEKGKPALENYDSTLNDRKTFAKVKANAYEANAGHVSTFVGNEDVLAQALFQVTNKLELALNPQERRYTVYTSSAGSQWVREADGGHFNKFQELGDLGDGVLAGLTLPYQLKKVKIGGHATGYFISTNSRTSEVVSAQFVPKWRTQQVTVDTLKHKYVVLTNYEDTLDTYLFLQGPEFIEEGTGTDAYARNKSLQLETMFDITAFNESMGVVEFAEEPLAFS